MRTFTFSGKCQLFLSLLLMGSQSVWAQSTNYVANTANTTYPGVRNTLVGPGAGNTTMSGGDNTILGANSGINNTTGSSNTFVGNFAGQSNTVGIQNVFIGYRAGLSNISGSFNIVLGTNAGGSNTSGQGNTFIGSGTGQLNTTGGSNTFLGKEAGVYNKTGIENTFVGSQAGYYNTADANTFMGYQAGSSNTSGENNTFVGHSAGSLNNTGSQNTFTGSRVGIFNKASANTFMGNQAGFSNTTGGSNVFIGNLAGYNNTTGQSNMLLGPQAGTNNTTGSYNLLIGNAAGNATTTGSGNTAIGDGSAAQNTTGENNTFIGRYAGFDSQTGNNNVFIGFAAKAGTVNPTNLNNAVAIGANSIVSQDNSVILGSTNSSVGIGNSAPKNKLEITQGTANQSGLRLTNLTSASPASLTNQSKFLTVNDQGDVVLASLNGSGRLGVNESLWERKGQFLQSLQGEAVIIGSKISQTPAGYKLFVEDGILTEKVKVAIKNTAEWSDKVFDSSYQLKPLVEVEQYVKMNKHLPGVPSATEVVEQGIDVGRMDAKLLEKIEELTLYAIEARRRDEQQQREITRLKQENRQIKKLLNRRMTSK